jgi:hypothetical protein
VLQDAGTEDVFLGGEKMRIAQRWMSACAVISLMVSTSVLADEGQYQAGEIIVKYKDNFFRSNALMDHLYDNLGVQNVHYYTGVFNQFEHLILDRDANVQEAIEKLEKSGLVEYAEPNYIITLPETILTETRSASRRSEASNHVGAYGVPCFPGMDIPGCNPDLCWIPGIPMPPGCRDSGGDPGNPPRDPGQPPPRPGRPDVAQPPAEVNPPQVDPDINKAWGLAKSGAIDAWEIEMGSQDIVVAVIDTGIDYNHEDLAFNVWRNPNPTQGDEVGFDFIHNDGLPFDDQGHGTHVAGTIGAVGGNGLGVAGVSQRVSIMGLKFLSSEGSGTLAGAIKSIDYAVENGAQILNNSWGGRGPRSQALYDAIIRAEKAGVLFVAAAGNDGVDNDGSSRSWPAAFETENMIAVAATDEEDGLAFFSNFGKKTTHLAAPGVNVYSLLPGNKYKAFSGTSMAAPHVAGAAALVWAHNPGWNYKQVKNALLKSVDPLGPLNGKTITGGRLNVLEALRSTD